MISVRGRNRRAPWSKRWVCSEDDNLRKTEEEAEEGEEEGGGEEEEEEGEEEEGEEGGGEEEGGRGGGGEYNAKIHLGPNKIITRTLFLPARPGLLLALR